MKEIMDEIKKRFDKELENQNVTLWKKDQIMETFDRISSEVYLEKLSQFLDRK